MQLSPKQDAAIRAVDEWFHNSDKQVFRLDGYAGTGKSTIAKKFEENVKGSVLYAAFTGKAAHVLRTKGCNASTIHSLCYRLVEDDDGGDPVFELDPESPLAFASLLIVDEVSMVGPDMGQDLLSFGVKILVLGDPMQLPPISGAGFFHQGEPDFLLDEIHRQAEDSPIIRLATAIRQERLPLVGKYGDSEVMFGMPEELILSCDQLLVGKNATRTLANKKYRMLKGFQEQLPMKEDKLVCLRNSKREGLFNGMTWFVDEPNTPYRGEEENRYENAFIADIRAEDNPDMKRRGVQMHKEIFYGDPLPDSNYIRRQANEFDYGYALTCHKAQGSQWDHVVIWNEFFIFGENRWRWLYTAVTRAAKKVHICKKG